MSKRPWPIVIISLFYFFGPIFNTAFSAFLMKQGPIEFLRERWIYDSVWSHLIFWGLYPVTGLAIYAMQRWSYAFYLASMTLIMHHNYTVWSQYPEIFKLHYFIIVSLLNVAVVSYFLIPAVRRFYFDKTLRWWELKPRYKTEVEAYYRDARGKESKCYIRNLSEGGAFIRCNEELTDKSISLRFNFLAHHVHVPCLVVHKSDLGEGYWGYGLSFVHNHASKKQMKRIAREMRMNGYELTRASKPWQQDFVEWFDTLRLTGRGLIPDVHKVREPVPTAGTVSDESSQRDKVA